jgi:hypothetical protein
MIKNDEIDLIINTPSGKTPRKDEVQIRSTAVERRIPILTTMSGAEASIRAIRLVTDRKSLFGCHRRAPTESVLKPRKEE